MPKKKKLKNGGRIKPAKCRNGIAKKVKKGDGKDVHHKDRNPKNNKTSNLKVVSKSKNRSVRRT